MGHNNAPNKQANRSNEKLHQQINDRKRNAHVHKKRLGKNMRNRIKCFTKIDRAENALGGLRPCAEGLPKVFFCTTTEKENNDISGRSTLMGMAVLVLQSKF